MQKVSEKETAYSKTCSYLLDPHNKRQVFPISLFGAAHAQMTDSWGTVHVLLRLLSTSWSTPVRSLQIR